MDDVDWSDSLHSLEFPPSLPSFLPSRYSGGTIPNTRTYPEAVHDVRRYCQLGTKEGKGREGKGTRYCQLGTKEGKGREGKGREGKGRDGKGREGMKWKGRGKRKKERKEGCQ
jgi:hypothetical protein